MRSDLKSLEDVAPDKVFLFSADDCLDLVSFVLVRLISIGIELVGIFFILFIQLILTSVVITPVLVDNDFQVAHSSEIDLLSSLGLVLELGHLHQACRVHDDLHQASYKIL